MNAHTNPLDLLTRVMQNARVSAWEYHHDEYPVQGIPYRVLCYLNGLEDIARRELGY